jgi:transposase InsO family protein
MSGYGYGYVLPGASRFYNTRERGDLSREAQKRLERLDWHRAHGENARKTCRHFGISPDTFYRWKKRYDERRLRSLESASRRPHRLRRPSWKASWVAEVKRWREAYPRWGKEKIWALMGGKKAPCSMSTVGRILGHLKKRGLIQEPPKLAAKRRRRSPRPWARRKPWEYRPEAPGDLVQVDTMDQEIRPGLRRKQFTARDTVSKFDGIKAYARATSRCARYFLDHLDKTFPFPVKAIQIDGGSEFKGEFERECAERKIPLYVLPPRSPKLNGCVERSNRTHAEEFYDIRDVPDDLDAHNRGLLRQEYVYNFIRPHQALGLRTPAQFVAEFQSKGEKVSGMY